MSLDVARISHDLRTPLNAIKSWAAVLDAQLRSNDDPVVRQALQGIMRGVDQQASLIDELSRWK
jgi:signal transduction histidine kinase